MDVEYTFPIYFLNNSWSYWALFISACYSKEKIQVNTVYHTVCCLGSLNLKD